MADLSSYKQVQTGLFVTITLSNSTVWRFSDYNTVISFGGNTYTGLGKFVGITSSTSELKPSSGNITITITGIPNTSITDILNNPVKGAKVEVLRAFFNPSTGVLLNIAGNPTGRFYGVISNYTIDESYDMESRTSNNTVALTCNNNIEILENKIAGRKTNPSSFKMFYPNDVSMDRVPNLVGANFDFGKPQ